MKKGKIPPFKLRPKINFVSEIKDSDKETKKFSSFNTQRDFTLKQIKDTDIVNDYTSIEQFLLKVLDSKEIITSSEFESVTHKVSSKLWYSWVNDYVLYACIEKMKDKDQLEELQLNGNRFLTDQGIIWLSKNIDAFKALKRINLNGCSKVTERSLIYLISSKLPSDVELNIKHTNVKYVPETLTERCYFHKYQLTMNPKNNDYSLSYPIVMWPSRSVSISGLSVLLDKKETEFSGNFFEHRCSAKLFDDLPLVNIMNFKFTEVPMHSILPEQVAQVIIFVHDEIHEAEEHIIESIATFAANQLTYKVEGNDSLSSLKKKSSSTDAYFWSTFVVVGIGKNAKAVTDQLNKYEWIKKIDEKCNKLNEIIQQINKKPVPSIDFKDQQRLGMAVKQLENLKNFSLNAKPRIKIFNVDPKDSSNIEAVLETVKKNIKERLVIEQNRYYTTDMSDALKVMMKKGWNYCTLQSFQNIFKPEHLTQLMAEHLYGFYFPNSEIFVFNVSWFDQLLQVLLQDAPSESNYKAVGLHPTAKIWTESSLLELLNKYKIAKDDQSRWIFNLMDLGVLVRLPCIRYSMKDEQWFYINPMISKSAKLSHLKVIRDSIDKTSKKIMVGMEYSKINQDIYSLYPALLSRIVFIGHLQLLSPMAAVIHINGGVELIIESTEACLSITAFSPLPLTATGSGIFEVNQMYFMWNTLHLFTDAMESLLVKQNILVDIKSTSVAQPIPNYSVGYRHNWSLGSNLHSNVCSLCNNCCKVNKFTTDSCEFNRISSRRRGFCLCLDLSTTCVDCGICFDCFEQHRTYNSTVNPNLLIFCSKNTDSTNTDSIIPLGDALLYSTKIHFQSFGTSTSALSNPFIGLKSKETGEIIDVFSSSQVSIEVLKDSSQIKKMADISGTFWLERVLGQEIVKKKFEYLTLNHMNLVADWNLLTFQYSSKKTSPEVGIMIGKYPLSAHRNKFSIEITNPGKHGYIAVGVVPSRFIGNRQPGWISGSVALHADDGGLYVGRGSHSLSFDTFKKAGTIVELEMEMDTKTLIFRVNGKKIVEQTVKTDENYPAIGMHSALEQVRLLDRTVWSSDDTNLENMTELIDSIQLKENVSISPQNTLEIDENNVGIISIKSKEPIESVQFVTMKSKNLENIITLIDVFNKDLMQSNDESTVKFKEIEDSVNVIYTFAVSFSKAVNELYSLKIDIKLLSGNMVSKEWNILSIAFPKHCRSNVQIQPMSDKSQKTIFHSDILHVSSINEVGHMTNRSYYISKDSYDIIVQGNKDKCFIYSDEFPKPSFTRSFMIGNLLKYKDKTSMVMDYSNKQLKLFSEKTPLKNLDGLTPLFKPSKPILKLTSSFNSNFKKFSLINSTVFKTPPPSFPWPFLFQDVKLTDVMNDTIYVATRCNEYYGMTLMTLNNISRCESNKDLGSISTSVVLLPFYSETVEDSSLLLWRHSLMDILDSSNYAFFFMCYGKSDLYKCVPHLLNTTGVSVKSVLSKDIYEAVFFNPDITEANKILVNNKLVIANHTKILPHITSDFSMKDVETFMSIIFEKITTFMIISNLLTEKHFDKPLEFKTQVETIIQQSNEMLISDRGYISCRLHSSMSCDLLDLQEILDKGTNLNSLLDNAVFDYANCTQSLVLTGERFETIPENIFIKFINLKSLEIRDFPKVTNIPKSLYQVKGLERLVLHRSGLKCLPNIKKFPLLKFFTVKNSVAQEFDGLDGESTKMTHLKLHHIPLSSYPKELCNFHQLEILDIQLSGLTSLPKEFENLINLTELKIFGSFIYYQLESPEFGEIKEEMPEIMYPEISKYNITETKDGILRFMSPVKCFTEIPRLGSDEKENGDANEDGFPTCILKLRNLISLTINHTSIKILPKNFSQLTQLESINLNYNPQLEDVNSLSGINSLKRISLLHCGKLRAPPREIIGRGNMHIMAYLKFLQIQHVRCNRTKLMLVGLGAVGKTSLMRALINSGSMEAGSSGNKQAESPLSVTDGIDIKTWEVTASNDVKLQYSIWDFAGQDVYYNTHQFFLSDQAIYVIVWSIRQGLEHGALDFWLSSIASHAKEAPVIIVGTNCTQVKLDTSSYSNLRSRYPQIKNCFEVDSPTMTGISQLKEYLIELTLKQPYIDKDIPMSVLDVETEIIQIRSQKKYMEIEEFESVALKCGILKDDIDQLIQILHDFGSIQYFNTDLLKSKVVIDPQWIVDIMANVVSVVDQKITNGIFYHKDMEKVWAEFPPELHSWMLSLTEEFDLTFPHPDIKLQANIVPCLLPEIEPEIEWPKCTADKRWTYSQIFYNFDFLPAGLFNRVQVRLFDFTTTVKCWKFGTYFIKNEHNVLLKREEKNRLTIRAIGVNPVNVLAMVDEVIMSIVRVSFPGITYLQEVSCPDCVHEGRNQSSDAMNYWTPVCMIPYSVISKAKKKKCELIQCHEMHLNSLKSLKDHTPETQPLDDFITDMQSKIETVEGLANSSNPTFCMLYSEKDVKEGYLCIDDFMKIYKELNLSCYKICNTEEPHWKKQITYSHVCIVGLSENFNNSKDLSDIMHYVINVRKNYILLITGPTNVCKSCSFGINTDKVFVKINKKNVDQYGNKLNELKVEIKKRLTEHTEEIGLYDCFISYCWSNSYDAVEKGTKKVADAPACKATDPRKLQAFLEENGIKCWIDQTNLSKDSSLTIQLSKAIQKSKMMIAFISKQYEESENCMMELRYMSEAMKRPIVFVQIGTEISNFSEIAMLLHKGKSQKLNFMVEAMVNRTELLNVVKATLNKCKEVTVENNVTNSETNNNSALYEQVELTFRKFLNQLTSVVGNNNPRLVVIDIEDKLIEEGETAEEKLKNGEIDEEPRLVIRFICENEDSWHLTEDSLPIEPDNNVLEIGAPYLHTFYQVLLYKNPGLHCLEKSNSATLFLNRIAIMATNSDKKFKDSYSNFINYVFGYLEREEKNPSLDRYRLPSGRELWLCTKDAEEHKRCRKIDRNAASKEDFVNPVTSYDDLLSKNIEEELLKKQGQTVPNKITKPVNKEPVVEKPEPYKRIIHHHKPIRQDTLLLMDKAILTNASNDVHKWNSRSGDDSKDKQSEATKKTKTSETMDDTHDIQGSRICSIQ